MWSSIGTVIIIGKLYKNLKIILRFIAGCDKYKQNLVQN
jgi:hypothetical protein